MFQRGDNLPLDPSTLIAFVVGLIAIYVIGLLLVIPIKIVLKLIVNGLIGGVTLFIVNFIAGLIGLTTVGINPVTAIIAGILGVPGVILLFIIQAIT